MRIILLEPDRLLANSYRSSLEQAGHTVAYAQTAQGAIGLADEQMPDAVVLEIAGARHNGIEFLYEFRSYFEWLPVPAIVLTSLPAKELAQNTTLLSDLGVRTVLPKVGTDLRQLNARVAALAEPSRS